MAYFGKFFKLSKVENFEEFQEESGQPSVDPASWVGVMAVKLDKLSDSTYTFTTDFGGFSDSVTFELGKETVEKTRPDGTKYTSLFTFDGDVLKEAMKLSTGKTTIIIRKYSDNKIESTLQNEGSSTVAIMDWTA